MGLSAWLLAGRFLHDLHHRGVRVTRHRLVPRGPEQPPEQHAARARNLLARLPGTAIERLAADAGMPHWLAEPFAADTLARKGADVFLRAASAHRTERGTWRRIAALRVLCAGHHPQAVPLLEAALLDGNGDLAAAAVSLLGSQRTRAAGELLLRALRERRHPFSRVAARLDRFPLDIPDLLLPLVTDADATLRFWGATLLARYGSSPEVAPALAGRATDTDPLVRKAAVESLGVVGGPWAVETALALLCDSVWFVRAHAARALGDLARADLAPRVLPLLADPQWWVRTAAKDALQAMGPAVARDVEGYLGHADRFARNGAAEVLQNLGRLDEIAARAGRGEASQTERDLLARASAEGGMAVASGLVRRVLPSLADRIPLVVAAEARRRAP